MSPRLHPSLDQGPAPKPVCVGCHATGDTAVLVPIGDSTTMFICFACAGVACFDATIEMIRRPTAALHHAVSPEVPA